MEVFGELKKLEGEGEKHFKGRKIISKHLISKYKDHFLRLYFEYPPAGRRRGNVVVVYFKPPFFRIKVWIEIQDTPLARDEWPKRIHDIQNAFNPEKIWVYLTKEIYEKEFKKLQPMFESFKNLSVFGVDLNKEQIF